jgi:hypothetical protein
MSESRKPDYKTKFERMRANEERKRSKMKSSKKNRVENGIRGEIENKERDEEIQINSKKIEVRCGYAMT